jgi:hypothetical protein
MASNALVYGHMVVGKDQFEVDRLRASAPGNGAYGKMIPQGIKPEVVPFVVDDIPFSPGIPEPVAFIPPQGTVVAPPNSSEPSMDEILAAARESAKQRAEAVLGESYSVPNAVTQMRATPDLWTDLAEAELGRGDTAGVRKSLVQALLAQAPTDADPALVAALQGAIA